MKGPSVWRRRGIITGTRHPEVILVMPAPAAGVAELFPENVPVVRVFAVELVVVAAEAEAGVAAEAEVGGGDDGGFGVVRGAAVEDQVGQAEVEFVRGGVVERYAGCVCG